MMCFARAHADEFCVARATEHRLDQFAGSQAHSCRLFLNGLQIASDSLKGRVFEVSLADLQQVGSAWLPSLQLLLA
jgi:hypothetical protein